MDFRSLSLFPTIGRKKFNQGNRNPTEDYLGFLKEKLVANMFWEQSAVLHINMLIIIIIILQNYKHLPQLQIPMMFCCTKSLSYFFLNIADHQQERKVTQRPRFQSNWGDGILESLEGEKERKKNTSCHLCTKMLQVHLEEEIKFIKSNIQYQHGLDKFTLQQTYCHSFQFFIVFSAMPNIPRLFNVSFA